MIGDPDLSVGSPNDIDHEDEIERLQAELESLRISANHERITRRSAEAEIDRLQAAKRAALAIADERSKENVKLRAALETIARTTFSGDEMGDDYQRGNRDAHKTCAGMARQAIQ